MMEKQIQTVLIATKEEKYFGLFIEPDKKRFQKLNSNTQNMNCKNINSIVSVQGNYSLNNILKENDISENS